MIAGGDTRIRCEFRFKCPTAWHLLTPTASETIRRCPACERDVFLVTSEAELRDRAARGQCVAVPVTEPSTADTRPGDPGSYVLGQVDAPYSAD